MARQSRKKGRKATAEQLVKAAISLEGIEDSPLFYVNYVEVAHSQHDFVAFCAQLPVKLSPQDREEAIRTGVLKQEPLVRLIFPPTMLPGLIRALESQREIYESTYGKISEATGGSEV